MGKKEKIGKGGSYGKKLIDYAPKICYNTYIKDEGGNNMKEYNGTTFKYEVTNEEDIKLLKRYIDTGKDLEDVVEEFPQLTKKQIIGKLIAYGVYEKFEIRVVEPSKEDIVESIEELLEVKLPGLSRVNKKTLTTLLEAVEKQTGKSRYDEMSRKLDELGRQFTENEKNLEV